MKNSRPTKSYFFIVICFGILLFSNCQNNQSEVENPKSFIDLSGLWKIESVKCIKISQCDKLVEGAQIHLPRDLRKIDSNFYGRIVFTKKFRISSENQDNILFIAGAIGSTDKVLINGKMIGSIGREFDVNRISAIWMLPRQYRIDSEYFIPGENVIQVEIGVYDEKAGIYSEPLALADEIIANDLLRWKYIFNVFLPFAIFGICGFITLFIFIALLFNNLPKYYYLYLGAANFYLFYILHFLPVNIGIDYLSAVQLYFSGGLITASLISLFYLRIIKSYFKITDISFCFLGILLVPLHFLILDFQYVYSIAKWINIYVTFLLGSIVWFSYLGKDNRYATSRYSNIIFVPSLISFLASFWDLLVRFHFLNMPFVFNYFSMIYSILIFVIHTQEVVDSRKKVSEFREQQLQQRLNIARDIHDIIGAELTGMMHLFNSDQGKIKLFSEFNDRISLILENIKDFIGILNGDKNFNSDLNGKINNYIQRLKSIPELTVTTDIQNIENKLPFREMNEIYKIFLESVSNVLQHSEATNLFITLKFKSNKLIFAIRDNGNGKISKSLKYSGINQQSYEGNHKGNGLKNMNYRAKSIGSKFRILSSPEKGSLIYLSKIF
ncbi:sensor histidine kinase [Leptospira sp. GIMC2001]|uniref:sensor histidine kinase n=1 Tax=Leptospira sp. GIMC2001 TaxID=1513297 RepID=UPI00234BF257|nr:ATP-binding protein [Leptospira sp. GIMC2001]WCL49371.1 hypothetical protein O4O04_19090 [Leptospira sp. GIMC2001]